MPAITRVGDADVAHCSGMVRAVGSPNVFANGISISRQGDPNTVHLLPGSPCPPHSAPIASGSPNVKVNSLGTGRVGDELSGCTSVAAGSPNVFANTYPTAVVNLVMGWPQTVLSKEQATNILIAKSEEEEVGNFEAANTNETAEYGDGYFVQTNPRGDDSFQGNVSPVTGEIGAIQQNPADETIPPEMEYEEPIAESERVVFLPHTDPRIKQELRNILEQIAIDVNKTLSITSAYRSPEYNAKVGGKKKSKHMEGIAVDVVQSGWTLTERISFIESCITNGINGIGIYNSFTHIDLGGKRAWGPTGSYKSLPQQSWAVPTLQANGYHI